MADSQAGEAGVVCPVCQKTWSRGIDTCPEDGSWLHDETILETRAQRISSPPPRNFDTSDSTPLTKPRSFDSGETKKIVRSSYDDSMAQTTLQTTQALAHTIPDGFLMPRDLVPGTKAGEYEIEAKIGEGAMGTVYRAVHPTIGKRVAIKVMSHKLFDEPIAVQRFVAEARAVAAIRHPGIVDVFGFGHLPDGRTYLTMEWLEGESLAVRLSRGPMAFEEALEVLRQICRGLEAAHAKNIVHRDLKPENVFLVDHGDETTVKLLDFGLAKDVDQNAGVGVTRDGQILGTPLYMSPEQCRSKDVDHRTDIYALGCLGYLLLTGREPFHHDNAAELISAHLTTEPPRPRKRNNQLPSVIDTLLFNMLAKDAAARPALSEIRRALGTLLSRTSQPMAVASPSASAKLPVQSARSPTAPPMLDTSSTRPDREARRSLLAGTASHPAWIRVAIVLAVLAVVGFGIYAFSSLASVR